MTSYPQFTSPVYEEFFAHWLKKGQRLCDASTKKCVACLTIRYMLNRGTSVLLETLLESIISLVHGSNVASIGIGRMTLRRARLCFSAKKRISLVDVLSDDFPGMCGAPGTNLTNKTLVDAEICAPILTDGGNELYVTLGEIYRSILRQDAVAVTSTNLRKCRYLLLCFHLSQAYRMTADSVFQMWGATLWINVVATLYGSGGYPKIS